jgi:hypothetical protein
MKANDLEKDDECYVDFTDSLCTVTDIDYSYGRTSIMLSYYENGQYQRTSINHSKEVKLKDKR